VAFDAFLFFSVKGDNAVDVKGETQDKTYAGAFEISEFSFGAENTLSIGSATTGAGAGKATFKEFTVKKFVDKSSPYLLMTLGSGGHYKKVQLFLRKSGSAAGTSGKAYLSFAFGLVAVKSIEWSGSSGDDVPTETVIFEYGELAVGYKPQEKGGTLGATVPGLWSKLNNTNTPDIISTSDIEGSVSSS